MWFDPEIVEAVGAATPEWLVVALAFLSFLGSVYVIAPATVFAYWAGDRDRIGPWLGAVFAIYGLMALLKGLFSLSRPPLEPPVAAETLPAFAQPAYSHAAALTTSSFPSGHAMAATTFWLLVAIDLEAGSRRQRLALATAAIAVVLASRIVLGVHYVGDVVAGVAVGLALLALVVLVCERVADATGATLSLAALVGLTAIVLTGNADAVVVLGGSLGALFARYVAPRTAPGDGVGARLAGHGGLHDSLHSRRQLRLVVLGGCGLLVAGAGTVLVASDGPVVLGATAALAAWLVVAAPWFLDPGPGRTRRSTT